MTTSNKDVILLATLCRRSGAPRSSLLHFIALGLAALTLWTYNVEVIHAVRKEARLYIACGVLANNSSTLKKHSPAGCAVTSNQTSYQKKENEEEPVSFVPTIDVVNDSPDYDDEDDDKRSSNKLPEEEEEEEATSSFVVKTIDGENSSGQEDDKRWKGQDLLHHFEKMGPTAEMSLDLLPLLPKPQGDDVEIYNLPAWQRLNELLVYHPPSSGNSSTAGVNNGDSVKLCFMGGSITAGVGATEKGGRYRYDRVFVDTMVPLLPAATPNNDHDPARRRQQAIMVPLTATPNDDHDPARRQQKIIHLDNLGHGATTSYRSAYSMASFLPENTDIIVWEHAVNDDPGKSGYSCEMPNNGLILFLNRIREISAMRNRAPPLVILLYFWDKDLWKKFERWSKHGKIPGRTFQCHNHLAASYDFVVGSVNVGSYFNNRLEWNATSIKTWFYPTDFPADPVHPNKRAHWLAAFLLRHLVTDDKRVTTTAMPLLSETAKKAPLIINATCNLQKLPPASQKVVDILVHKQMLGSWTTMRPRNEKLGKGMIYPQHYHSRKVTEKKWKNLVNNGKISEGRNDRKYSFRLPCCSSGEFFYFDLSSATAATNIKNDYGGLWISALQLTFPDVYFEGLSNRVQDSFWDDSGQMLWNTTSNTTRDVLAANSSVEAETGSSNMPASVPVWSTLPMKECSIESWTWLVLPNETLVSRIDFCSFTCGGKEKSQQPATIMDLNLY